MNLQRIRAEPGTDSGLSESALVTLPASPWAACGGLGVGGHRGVQGGSLMGNE